MQGKVGLKQGWTMKSKATQRMTNARQGKNKKGLMQGTENTRQSKEDAR